MLFNAFQSDKSGQYIAPMSDELRIALRSNDGVSGRTLGNNTELRVGTPSDARERRREQYRLQNTAHDLVWSQQTTDASTGQQTKDRFTACMRVLADGTGNVQFSDDTRRARIGGMARCGKPTCPVCGFTRAESNRAVLTAAIEQAHKQGLRAVFVTYTLSHGLSATLMDTLSILQNAQQAMRGSQRFRRFKKRYGWIQSVKILETTRTTANGWHPHRHEIVLLDRLLCADEQADFEHELWEMWWHELNRLEAHCTREHGLVAKFVNLAEGQRELANYVTKYDALAKEMTYGNMKNDRANARKGRTPLQLLASAADGNDHDGQLWLEYYNAMHGRQFVVGMKAFCAAVGLDRDELLQQHEEACKQALEGYRDVLQLNQSHLTYLCDTRQRAAFCEHVELVNGDRLRIAKFFPTRLRESIVPVNDTHGLVKTGSVVIDEMRESGSAFEMILVNGGYGLLEKE